MAEAVRLTAFYDSERPKIEDWFSRVAGGDPEQRMSQPRTGAQQDVGVWQDRRLLLTATQKRVDWNIQRQAAPTQFPIRG